MREKLFKALALRGTLSWHGSSCTRKGVWVDG